MIRQIARVMVLLVGALVALAPAASAQPAAPASDKIPTRVVRGQLGASVNNLGLQNTLDVSWTWPLSDSDNPLLSGAHISAGLTHALTPSQTRFGGWVEYSPLSILDIRAGIDPTAYFGTFNALMGFDSYADPFDKEARDARGGNKAGSGARAYIAPVLKFRAGHIVAQSGAEFEWWRSSATGVFFYEPTRDTLLKSGGDRMVNTTSVTMYEHGLRSGGTLSGGVVHTLGYVFDAPANRIQKLGVIAIREFGSPHLHMAHPRVTLVVTRYLDDPSKAGQFSAAMAIGFRGGR